MRVGQGSAVFLPGLLCTLLVLTVHYVYSVSVLNQEDIESSYEVVFPERIDNHRARRDLDYQPEEDQEHALYKINAFGRNLVLDIHKNTVTIPKTVRVRTLDEHGEDAFKESKVKNCQYQGHVQGEPDSMVVLDTCDGLRGIIDDSQGELVIEPLKSKGSTAHKLSRTKKYENPNADFNCGVKVDRPVEEIRIEHAPKDRHRRSMAVDPRFRSYITINKTRYTEVIIVIDNKVYKKYNDSADVERRVMTLVNAVDMIYQRINIRIILTDIEIWKEKDKVPFNAKAGPDLANFQKYREANKDRFGKVDVVHLMRGKMWDDHGGMAYMSEMCTMRSTGVVAWNYWSPLGPWLAFAHEMGHNFGFDHDADHKNCKCLTPRGCIMATFKTRVPGFSDCNLKDLRKIDSSCLYNIPTQVKNPRCGNSIKEGAEQCDCGTPENCRIVDPCCNPKTCKLHSSAQCSDQHDRCCRKCQIVPAGIICRRATGECDVPETCNGVSSQCPSDDYITNGTTCHYNDMVLQGNTKTTDAKLTQLPRPIIAQYLRINPKKWFKDICMRTELHGCDIVGPVKMFTPIRSRNFLCVEAKDGSCYKNDKSKLAFVQSQSSCNERNLQFRLTRDRVLIHHCTGNRVCPENDIPSYGTKLVVSKDCKKQQSKFERVDKYNNLKHINSGLCVHPSGGYAQDGTPLVLWGGCNIARIALSFPNLDCQQPLGMSDVNKIPNAHITASSARANKDAIHSRLGGMNSWCAKKRDGEQYLQINLGKVKNITAITTEGIYDQSRVMNYQLFYSTNGKQWTPYTRNKVPRKNSCCISGTCMATKSPACGKRAAFMKPSCPKVYSVECAGNGVCTAQGKCHCNKGFDPATNCGNALPAQDGGWGKWSKWSKCSRVCGKGIQSRYRFCNSPAANNGGQYCKGRRLVRRACNKLKCPVANSCRHLQAIGLKQGKNYPSGVYTINPGNQGNVMTYCDMTRDGGGWTLLVTSHTNTWTARNVRRRSENKPTLNGDFSILYKANTIKDSNKIQGQEIEYRIEAHEFGRWGGIWKAPRAYSFVATTNDQTGVTLVKKFDKWYYEDFGIEQRMPWIHGAMLTTSETTHHKYAFGSITANIKRFYPAPWINNKEMEQHPTNIWYWMREGPYKAPKSCMEVQLTALMNNKPLTGKGIYNIEQGSRSLKSYCDFSSNGGGWTLLLTSASQSSWTMKNVLQRNSDVPSLLTDYSIVGASNDIIKNQHFQYKIEDDQQSWGGIFEAGAGLGLTSRRRKGRPRLLKKFGNWDENTANLADSVPYIGDHTNLLTTSVSKCDSSGALVPKRNGGVVRLWVREGTWRSCNEIKLKTQQKLTDGTYMVMNTSHQYLPVMCNMNSGPGAWTLLVTSASNGWTKEQVKRRNENKPSLSRDYSILELGDQIKSLSGGRTFKYKLEAKSPGRWGGVWEAPMNYSFVATNNQQTSVKLIKKFDVWPYNKWHVAIEKRMPWLGKKAGLLTTSTNYDYYEYGSIVHELKKNNPAPWINVKGMTNPGTIWYWVNEEDCGSKNNIVHGGVSSWSPWSECSPMCSKTRGERTRQRTCTNPKPRCGGRSCDPRLLAIEKQQCVYCPKSPIKNNNNLCIQPSTADCNPPDGTQLVYTRDQNNCKKPHMYFTLGKDSILVHHCSGKKVCPKDGGDPLLILSSSCDPSKAKYEQTPDKELKHLATGHCVHPYRTAVPTEGTKLVTYYTCHLPKLKLNLFQLGRTAAPRILKTLKPKAKPKAKKLNKKRCPTVNKKTKKPNSKAAQNKKARRVSAIRAVGGFCLQPSTANCSPSNGTEIVYHGNGGKNVTCDKKYMKFMMSGNGVLKHVCSKMFICPDPYYYDAGVKFWSDLEIPVILQQHPCQPHVAKLRYIRTPSKALVVKKSNLCVQSDSNGKPKPNSKAVLGNQCNPSYVALDFYEL